MPLVAIFGLQVRQPIAGDFGFSRRAVLGDGKKVKGWLGREWLPSTYRYGIDNFMTTSVILDDLKIVEAVIGAKIHDPSAPKLSWMFVEVVKTLLNSVIENKTAWTKKKGLKKIKRINIKGINVEPPQILKADEKMLAQTFLDGFAGTKGHDGFSGKDRLKVLNKILRPIVAESLQQMILAKDCKITAELWVDIVIDFIAAYAKAGNERQQDLLIGSMMFLYFGRVATFVREIEGFVKQAKGSAAAVERKAHQMAEEITYDLAGKFARRRSELAGLL